MNNNIKRISAALIVILGFGLLSCSNKQPEQEGFKPNPSSSLPDYMQEEINKDYETVEKPEASEKEKQAIPSHLKASDELFQTMNENKNKDQIVINEKVFITQINDIFYNFEDYEDKIIVVEGMYSVFESSISDATSPVVYRNGPGCCNNDGWAGFLLKYDGELPEENEWIRVTGTPLLENTEEGYSNLYLNVEKLEILNTRGVELVLQ